MGILSIHKMTCCSGVCFGKRGTGESSRNKELLLLCALVNVLLISLLILLQGSGLFEGK